LRQLCLLLLVVLCSMFPNMSLAAKPVPRDIAYILGLYYGDGARFLIRENNGNLELLYSYDSENRDFSHSNTFPLKKEHFDSYTINEEGPVLSAEEAVHFERNSLGQGITCSIGGKRFSRFFYPGQNNEPFRFPPAANYDNLVKAAAAAPEPENLKRGQEVKLVNLLTAVPQVKPDLRYATNNNCFGKPLYTAIKAYASTDVATALTKVAHVLAQDGYGLLIWEAYRPWSASKLAYDLLPAGNKNMLAAPAQGDIHNTGLAVDVSLYDLKTGLAVPMISDYDEISPRQYSKYPGGTTEQRYLRDYLQKVMHQSGFTASEMEWWHFTLGDGTGYSHLNIPFTSLS
jgi:D-alanyl-D-alanine dipeptidase